MPSRPTIFFVWNPGESLPAGTGGSENYTIGQVRELNRRGIRAEVVTTGVGVTDGRAEFSGVPFRALATIADVSDLDGIVVFVTEFPAIPTRRRAYQMLHIPPPNRQSDRRRMAASASGRSLVATSQFAATLWSTFFEVPLTEVHVVYPFAEACFGIQARSTYDASTLRLLYAGRLSAEKGIFTALEMLHLDLIDADVRVTFTATTAGADKRHGRTIQRLLEVHPEVRLIEARKTPAAMAELMAEHDVVVMPSNSQYWHETFGIVSIEAQHAGCRVVASDDGGLPETDCGAITYVAPGDASALARGINAALALGPVSPAVRQAARVRFTVEQSVDDLLAVFDRGHASTPAAIDRELEALASPHQPIDPAARRRPEKEYR